MHSYTLEEARRITKIEGDYNNQRPYLIADKLIGNVNFCLGLLLDEETKYYVPASTLLEDIKKLTNTPSQVLAVFSKEKAAMIYDKIRHVAKGLNLYNLELPKNIIEKISLENYISKDK